MSLDLNELGLSQIVSRRHGTCMSEGVDDCLVAGSVVIERIKSSQVKLS